MSHQGMIQLTDKDGAAIYIRPEAIISIKETPRRSKIQGSQSVVKAAGLTYYCKESAQEILVTLFPPDDSGEELPGIIMPKTSNLNETRKCREVVRHLNRLGDMDPLWEFLNDYFLGRTAAEQAAEYDEEDDEDDY